MMAMTKYMPETWICQHTILSLCIKTKTTWRQNIILTYILTLPEMEMRNKAIFKIFSAGFTDQICKIGLISISFAEKIRFNLYSGGKVAWKGTWLS